MEKQSMTHLLCFSLALAVIFGGSTIYYAHRESLYANYTQAQHQKSLSQLLSSLNHLETSLEKARYAPEGPLRQTLAADIWMESQLAASAMSALPLGDQRLEQTETYISQVGDYAYYLMRASAYQRADNEEWDTLCSLCDNASGILSSLGSLKEQSDSGQVQFRSVSAGRQDADGVSAALSKINDEFPEYASLIYDGPYSDHIAQRTPKALEGQSNLSAQEAQEKAARLLNQDPSQLTADYTSEGQIPCYGFSSGSQTAAITKQGGFLLSFTDSRETGEAKLSPQQAIEKAKDFLESVGLTNLESSYYTTYETIATINFASRENGALSYPDLVKVGVALDDGSVVRLDAAGYAMNHHDRPVPTSAVPLEKARELVPDTLSIQGEALTYIPTTGQQEVLCWEFTCQTPEKGHALFYVNCDNGQAENLLLLIEAENGTLTR